MKSKKHDDDDEYNEYDEYNDDEDTVISPTPTSHRDSPDFSSQGTGASSDTDDTEHHDTKKAKCEQMMESVKRRMSRLHNLTDRVSNLQEAIVRKQAKAQQCLKEYKTRSKCGAGRRVKHTRRGAKKSLRSRLTRGRGQGRGHGRKRTARR